MTGTEYKVMGVVTWLVGLAIHLFGAAHPNGFNVTAIGLFLYVAGDIIKAIERIGK